MSGSIRLYIPVPLFAGAEITASSAQAHYLGSVMRRAVGGSVLIFNGEHGEWRATITALKRDRLVLHLAEQTRPQAPEADIWLLFAPLKRDATDLVVEKATELGVSALLPVLTERTNTARINPERLEAIAAEAAEQCERLTVPRIAAPRKLWDVLGDWPSDRHLIAAIERDGAARHAAPQPGPSALLVGPEGGFTPMELDALRRHALVVPASLGPRILRAETAAIAGLALLLAPAGG
jgi:16S rRNA (uracil1498-N3)-methyltransferase